MITQNGRWLRIESPLGKDALVLTSFVGDEAISQPFFFRLTVLSREEHIAPSSVLGKHFTVHLHAHGSQTRLFNGIARSIAPGPTVIRGYRQYEIELVPAFWFLTLRSDCRIFEKKSVKEIIGSVLSECGVTDFDDKGIRGNHPKREYCVQYRETHYNFLSRLMEEEGIFYYFRHEHGRHVMVLGDQVSAYGKCREESVSYSDAQDTFNIVTNWRPESEFRSGKVSLADYNFKNVATVLSHSSSVVDVPEITSYELYDYPGGSDVKADLDTLTQTRMEEEECQHKLVDGQSSCTSFTAGAKFKFKHHPFKEEVGKGYALTSVHHAAEDETNLMEGAIPSYHNIFHCIPEGVVFRPRQSTPKALVRGPQTALVVGPDGEEVHCDEHGRIRVRFHWDRKRHQSCWVRVAQNWSGKGWGTIFIPRIGMEVVVDFLEGDPDRPLVVGTVYNGKNPVPYDLPANASRSGVKTRSMKGGGDANFNELRFEDKKGAEEVYFHAERDFRREVERNDSLSVGHDQTIKVRNNRTETVEKGNETVTIATGNRSITVETGNDSKTVSKGNHSTSVAKGDYSTSVAKGNHVTKVDTGKVTVEAMQAIELKVGGNSIKIDQSGITVTGMMVKIQGDTMLKASSPMVQVQGDGMVTIKGGIVMVN